MAMPLDILCRLQQITLTYSLRLYDDHNLVPIYRLNCADYSSRFW
ncbi:hypothetical protein Pla111_18790 [Botrimarina hoheduenensis]|uniref:Uncharacterized protein n=1 Tax=Botrimarina hoheduenensis TaxID=2528000 RepID=A0A5C5W7D1_9BACT|nr:hypothetical protein Pla111_18790 [Botrimarina hoheduenensis]